ncbi:hydroxyacid dehydrogenase [Halomarina oriensis]|uniref:Hydroxyacid dehydrogenase n=1 Tax=Halomarina oriensis TaxID=671145 RepID=A0A6B0GNY7_9EURY|nr:hydroxyacid dehydrogenase [Halomarina oriensis]MWG33855.1 hydroxyacid dehydrogenase [Halomarina oriensis]
METLVTLPDSLRRRLLSPDVERRLEALGTVTWNGSDEQFRPADLREALAGVDVCVTGWGTPRLTEAVIADADALELMAHVGGSVGALASHALYDRDVTVCSAIGTMAPFVAEGVLAHLLATLRDLPAFDRDLRAGEWPKVPDRSDSLFGRTVGFVGLGAVGGELLDLLAPFDVEVLVYDPYVGTDRLSNHSNARIAALDETLRSADAVSVHAAKTPETVGLLDAERLALLRDGTVLVNAARGAVVDEDALVAELESGRIRAALDVFEREPLPADSPLRSLDAVSLTPHVAGAPAERHLAGTVVAEVERFAAGDPLRHTISRERFETMTDDSL